MTTLRRIMGKAILSIIAEDIRRAAGSVQLCAGQIAGIKATIHAMQTVFENLNIEAALRNMHNIMSCPCHHHHHTPSN